ncbi:MAG TPA: signal peptidase I [Candidatus Paceibacterota bacterium]|nr:signal peptidase I [Candidatus Paceibacterota bacterium]
MSDENTSPQNLSSSENTAKKGGFFKELVKFVFFILIILVPLRVFVAQPFIVVGTSMEPTFSGGEYLIVDELSYHLGNPSRGDVIIFHPPRQAFTDQGIKPQSGIYYIKRIIGLPNETIVIQDNQIIIKNQEHPNGFVLDEPYVKYSGEKNETITLGPDQYFVLGDNRPVSFDSRAWGPLSRDEIVGRAFLRLLPIDRVSFMPGAVKEKPTN